MSAVVHAVLCLNWVCIEVFAEQAEQKQFLEEAVTHCAWFCREVFAEQAQQNQFFEVQELNVKDAQVAGASFLLPETPPV